MEAVRPMTALFHGGVPGLRVGDLIQPGHERQLHDDCLWCQARANNVPGPAGIDDRTGRRDRVYATSSRLYAKHYASLWGRGDLYRVEPVGEPEPSTEDSIDSICAPSLRVAAVLDRAVLLTDSERRRLHREWLAADKARGWAA
jgi:hypothetical protein